MEIINLTSIRESYRHYMITINRKYGKIQINTHFSSYIQAITNSSEICGLVFARERGSMYVGVTNEQNSNVLFLKYSQITNSYMRSDINIADELIKIFLEQEPDNDTYNIIVDKTNITQENNALLFRVTKIRKSKSNKIEWLKLTKNKDNNNV